LARERGRYLAAVRYAEFIAASGRDEDSTTQKEFARGAEFASPQAVSEEWT